MRISGGGDTSPTIVGDLWPSADGRFAQISWNNFDIGGCDGTPEPMPAGRALMVCGDGGSTVNDRTVLANMNADVFIEAGGQQEKVRGGTQRFTLQRLPRSALKGLEPFSVVNGSVVRPAAQTRLFGNGRAAALRLLCGAQDVERRQLCLLLVDQPPLILCKWGQHRVALDLSGSRRTTSQEPRVGNRGTSQRRQSPTRPAARRDPTRARH
jgi:hypothetical protein